MLHVLSNCNLFACAVDLFVVHWEFSDRIDVDELEWLEGVNNDSICKGILFYLKPLLPTSRFDDPLI